MDEQEAAKGGRGFRIRQLIGGLVIVGGGYLYGLNVIFDRRPS
jgi:hypothetical protein